MPSTATNDPKRFVRRRPSMSGGAPTADDATGCARGSFAEYPAGGSAREALLDLDDCHHFGRCDREAGLVGGHPVVARVAQALLGPLEREEPLALVGGQDPVPGHVRPGRVHVGHSSTTARDFSAWGVVLITVDYDEKGAVP